MSFHGCQLASASSDSGLLLGHDYVYAEPKYDGYRTVLINVASYSRQGNVWAQFAPLLEPLREFADELVFDGELNHSSGEWGKTSSLIKTKNAPIKMLREARFRLFDVIPKQDYIRGGTNIPYEERRKVLDEAITYFDSKYFTKSPAKLCRTEQEVRDAYNGYLLRGYEGAIVKHPDAGYMCNQRSKFWVKMKPWDTEEGIIVGMNEGEGKQMNMVATLEVMLNSGDRVLASGRMNYDLRKRMWQDQSEYMGKYVEIGWQSDERQVAKMRHRQFIRFRPDLDAEVTAFLDEQVNSKPSFGRIK